MAAGHLVHAEGIGNAHHRIVIDVRVAGLQVLAQRSEKQPRILPHIQHVAAHVGRFDLLDLDAIELHRALARQIQPGQHLQQCRFAAADAAQHRHPLTRIQRHAHLTHRIGRHRVVAEGQILGRQRTRRSGLAQIVPFRIAVGGRVHHTVQRGQRRFCLLVAHGQCRDARSRCNGAAGQNHRADQRPLRERAVTDQIHAPHHHRHRAHRLQQGGKVVHHGRNVAAFHRGAGGEGRGALVAGLHLAFHAQRLDGLGTFQRFHQNALLDAALAQMFLHIARQRNLCQRPHDHQNGNAGQRHPEERPRNGVDHPHEHQHEGQVGDGGQCGRGGKIAHRFEFTDGVGKGPGRLRTVFQP